MNEADFAARVFDRLGSLDAKVDSVLKGQEALGVRVDDHDKRLDARDVQDARRGAVFAAIGATIGVTFGAASAYLKERLFSGRPHS